MCVLNMGEFLKVFIDFDIILLLFSVLVFFGLQARWDFSAQSGVDPVPFALEGGILNHWTAREVRYPLSFFWVAAPESWGFPGGASGKEPTWTSQEI